MTPQSLDEDFGRFLALFGSPVHAQPMPEAAFDACAGLLPRQLFTYWREVGVCGFGDGLMWMTNPQEFEPLLARWLQGTLLRRRRDLAVIARTAFGELLVWASGKGQVALISPLEGIVFHYASADRAPAQAPGAEADAQMRRFWGGLRPETFEQEDDAQRPLFARLTYRLGPLQAEEMYGFRLHPSLGGSRSIANMARVPLLAQHDLALERGAPRFVAL